MAGTLVFTSFDMAAKTEHCNRVWNSSVVVSTGNEIRFNKKKKSEKIAGNDQIGERNRKNIPR